MINTLNLFGAAVVERVSTNQFLETFRSIVKSLAMPEKTKAMIGDLAAVTPTEPPTKPGGGEMSICEMYPDLASQEIDFLMTKYTGNMKRG
jgi:hypothetical protein